jgi:hypothetical protein
VSQLRSGLSPVNRREIASTRRGKVGRPRRRHVCRSDRTRSTQRLPFSLHVPWLRLHHNTPQRWARSATLLWLRHPAHPGIPTGTRLLVPNAGHTSRVYLHGRCVDSGEVETRIPAPPLPHRWPLPAHMTPPLQLAVHTVAKARNPSIKVFCQSLGGAEQMGQAALPESLPGLIDLLMARITGFAAWLAALGSRPPSLALCRGRICGRRSAGVGQVLVHARFEALKKSQAQQAYTPRRLLPLCDREVEPVRKGRWIMSITHDAISLCLVSFSLSQNRWRVSRKVWAAKPG